MKEKHNKPKEEAAAPQENTAALPQELEAVRKEKDELFARLQRVSADYANFEKRTARQISESIAYEKDRIIRSLLPVLDNFEHTLKAHSGETTDAMVRGVEIIYGQMLDILKSHGIEQIQAVGEKFDPSRHEGMMRREEPDKAHDIVLEEFQKGYMSNDRVLRPSRVVVNKTEPTGGSNPTAVEQPPGPEDEEE
jgi:molecular chaperone GrpE